LNVKSYNKTRENIKHCNTTTQKERKLFKIVTQQPKKKENYLNKTVGQSRGYYTN